MTGDNGPRVVSPSGSLIVVIVSWAMSMRANCRAYLPSTSQFLDNSRATALYQQYLRWPLLKSACWKYRNVVLSPGSSFIFNPFKKRRQSLTECWCIVLCCTALSRCLHFCKTLAWLLFSTSRWSVCILDTIVSNTVPAWVVPRSCGQYVRRLLVPTLGVWF